MGVKTFSISLLTLTNYYYTHLWQQDWAMFFTFRLTTAIDTWTVSFLFYIAHPTGTSYSAVCFLTHGMVAFHAWVKLTRTASRLYNIIDINPREWMKTIFTLVHTVMIRSFNKSIGKNVVFTHTCLFPKTTKRLTLRLL